MISCAVMKDFYIRDCAEHENQVITSSFLVSAKQIKPKKSGDIFLALTLCDRTGQIEAKMWDNVADAVDTFEQDDCTELFRDLRTDLEPFVHRAADQARQLERMRCDQRRTCTEQFC